VRLLKRLHLQVCVIKFEVRTVESDAAPLGEQAHDSLDSLDHPAALRGRVDPKHVRIGRKGAGAASEHHAPASQMIE